MRKEMKSQEEKIPEYFFNSEAQPIGCLEDGMFKKSVSSKNILRKHSAYGFDKNVIDRLSEKCKVVELFEYDTGRKLRITFEKLVKHAILEDFGYGPQYFVPLEWWDKISAEKYIKGKEDEDKIEY